MHKYFLHFAMHLQAVLLFARGGLLCMTGAKAALEGTPGWLCMCNVRVHVSLVCTLFSIHCM